MNSWICGYTFVVGALSHALYLFGIVLSHPILSPSSDLASRVLAGKDHFGVGRQGFARPLRMSGLSGKYLPGLDLPDPLPKWWILDLLGQILDLRGSALGNFRPARKSGGRENPCRADPGPTWAQLGLGSGWPGPAVLGSEPKIVSQKHEIVMKVVWDMFARGIS